jgi:hypothetical protein
MAFPISIHFMFLVAVLTAPLGLSTPLAARAAALVAPLGLSTPLAARAAALVAPHGLSIPLMALTVFKAPRRLSASPTVIFRGSHSSITSVSGPCPLPLPIGLIFLFISIRQLHKHQYIKNSILFGSSFIISELHLC